MVQNGIVIAVTAPDPAHAITKTMQTGQILIDGQVRVSRVVRAVTLWQRVRGLLGRRSLPAGHGMLLERCDAIHTVGMHFTIDVIFLDRAWRVCRVCCNISPGRLVVSGGWRASRALEVASGWLKGDDLVPGTTLTWLEDKKAVAV